jgi:hypothetical protein
MHIRYELNEQKQNFAGLTPKRRKTFNAFPKCAYSARKWTFRNRFVAADGSVGRLAEASAHLVNALLRDRRRECVIASRACPRSRKRPSEEHVPKSSTRFAGTIQNSDTTLGTVEDFDSFVVKERSLSSDCQSSFLNCRFCLHRGR